MLFVTMEESTCYREAANGEEWVQVMKEEIKTIEKNETWSLTDLAPSHKHIGLKWVYKLKKDAHGNITRHKTRFSCKGICAKTRN